MIRGEPAIGREQSREPRLYSVEPTWGLDHEAVIRFCGQGSEAAGPFSQRHCSHSRIRIAATSDRHRLPGSSNAVSCRTLFVLSRSRVLLTRVLLTPNQSPPPNSLLYRVYATTRKSSGEMIRKLSVIRSRKRSHFLGTVRLRKRRIADLNWAKVS